MYGKGYLLLRRYITPPKQVIKNTKPLACGAGAHSTFTLLISSLLSSPECLKLARTSLTRTHNNTPARTHTHTQLFIAHYYNSDLFVWFLNCLCYTSYMLCAVHRRLGTIWGGILFYIHWFEEKKNTIIQSGILQTATLANIRRTDSFVWCPLIQNPDTGSLYCI